MGGFGLSGDRHHTRVPPERFTESHASLSVFALHREGLLAPGASAWLQTAQGRCRLATHEAGEIWLDDQLVVIGTHPVLPQPVFLCPGCGQTRYKLFCVAGRWGCYRCHRLTHASRHTNRMLPAWHRLVRLRRKIAAPVLFSPIAQRPLRHRRFWREAREVRALEARLIEHGQKIAAVLENRYGRS